MVRDGLCSPPPAVFHVKKLIYDYDRHSQVQPPESAGSKHGAEEPGTPHPCRLTNLGDNKCFSGHMFSSYTVSIFLFTVVFLFWVLYYFLLSFQEDKE